MFMAAGLACFALSVSAGAAVTVTDSRLWIPLQKPTNPIAIDYRSINLKGEKITFDLRQQFIKPLTDGTTTYDALIHHYAVDCDAQLINRLWSRVYDAKAARNEGVEIHPQPGADRIGLANLKSLCVWRDHGYTVPDLGLDGKWEELESPVSTQKVFEAPAKRQKNGEFFLFTVRNEETPPRTDDGLTWRYIIGVSNYDCRKAESHSTVVLRYDMDEKPSAIAFYRDEPNVVKLDSNRERYAAACK
jgi:hypothetical protein